MPKPLTDTKAYQSLVTDLEELIQEGQQAALNALNTIRIETYWKMGRRMDRMKQLSDGKAAGTLISRLAADLKSESTLLYRILGFHQNWPRGVPAKLKKGELSWAHIVEVLGIKNKKQQDYYLKTAIREGWSRDSLRKAVQKDFFSIRSEPKRLKSGRATLKRNKDPLNVYKGLLSNVIDGDTLLINVDLGFHVSIQQRIRLRGVNTAELLLGPALRSLGEAGKSRLDLPSSARRAKLFVQKQLKGLNFLVVKTYKTDVHGRYVADVFYHPTIKNKESVFKKGLFLNQVLLDKGLAYPI